MDTKFLKIDNQRLKADLLLVRDLYIFLEKNDRMIKIREAGFFFDQDSLNNYLEKKAKFFIFAEDPNLDPSTIELYLEIPQIQRSSNESNSLTARTEIEKEKVESGVETRIGKSEEEIIPEQHFSSNDSDEEVNLIKGDSSSPEDGLRLKSSAEIKEHERRFGKSNTSLEETIVKGANEDEADSISRFGSEKPSPKDDSVFTFSASEKTDIPIYSVRKLQNILETSKENLVYSNREQQQTRGEKANSSLDLTILTAKDINDEVKAIVYSSIIAEKGKIIAEAFLAEKDPDLKDTLEKNLDEKIEQMKRVRANDSFELSEEEKKIAEERIKTFTMIADRIDLSNEERLIKLSAIAESMDESMKSTVEKIEMAKDQIQFDSVFKRKTSVNTTLANYISYLAYKLGYSNESFLVDLALTGLIQKNESNIDTSRLPSLTKFLIKQDIENCPQELIQEDAQLILKVANCYMSHDRYNPNSLSMEKEIYHDILKALLDEPNSKKENLEIWKQSFDKPAEMSILGYCGIISTKAHSKLRSVTKN